MLGLVAAGPLVSGAARASAATCQRTPTPNVGSRGNSLLGVSATSSTNAWAVGSYDNFARTGSRTLVEHWNGRAWRVQASPNRRAADDSVLYGVAATSSTNAWAVGRSYTIDNLTYRSLIEHWNGTAWKTQASPNLAGSLLFGVAAASSTNAWAVGSDGHGALIEHWNGKAWNVQASPKLAGGSLSDVAATSSTNAWAVGADGHDTLIEHWNGRAWTVQTSPTPQFFQDQYLQLSGVAATSSTNAWAVGHAYVISSPEPSPLYNPTHTLIEHWNGRTWKVQANPNPGTEQFGSELYGVAAASSTNAWAVGGGLIERWNGKAWKIQASPNLGGLHDVAATSSRNAWAVGDYFNSAHADRNLIEHCG